MKNIFVVSHEITNSGGSDIFPVFIVRLSIFPLKNSVWRYSRFPAPFTLNARASSKEIKRSHVDFAGGFPEWRPLILRSLSLSLSLSRSSRDILVYSYSIRVDVQRMEFERRTFLDASRNERRSIFFFFRRLAPVDLPDEQVSVSVSRHESPSSMLKRARTTYARQLFSFANRTTN